MKRKIITCFLIIFLCLSLFFIINFLNKSKTIEAVVISSNNNKLVVKDINNTIYNFDFNSNIEIGSNIVITYNKNKIINYSIIFLDSIDFISDNGIFKDYYEIAYNKLKTLTLDEKIGQLFLARYNRTNTIDNLEKYKFGGYVFYKKDFEGKSTNEVKKMINDLQINSKIPLLTAVDEEGGKIVRISSNPNLYHAPFKSSSELYSIGSFELIKQDTINKSKLLNNLGLNLNLAPVVDVSTNPNDYMYERSFKQSTNLTKQYAKVVIETSKNTEVSYTLKHFPGYGNNIDTHFNSSVDTRSYEYILNNDLPPFEEGIKAGAEAILVSHNIVTSIDNNPASLSKKINDLLRNNLNFTGVIITDDLDMGATKAIDDAAIKAILAENNLLIVTDYQKIDSIKKAINEGLISEKLIDRLTLRVLAWKYYKGLISID